MPPPSIQGDRLPRLRGRAAAPAQLEQALHHPGADRHAARPGVPAARSGGSARPRRRSGHHLRPDPHHPAGDRSRPPARPAGSAVSQRPDGGQRCVRVAGRHHRRRRGRRPGLEDADGDAGRRPRRLAAVQAAAGAKATARVVGAYAVVRRQFGQPIARFDGVREPLARIAGRVYAMEAARVFTCGAVDAGRRPAVVSAMIKYRLTELARQDDAVAAPTPDASIHLSRRLTLALARGSLPQDSIEVGFEAGFLLRVEVRA